jgi:predicted alpha-1,2-mannosidase
MKTRMRNNFLYSIYKREKLRCSFPRCMKQSVFLCIWSFVQQTAFAQSLTPYVNPFIGTANSGNTYPNATAPQGMISVGVQNDDYANKPAHHAVSYTYGGKYFYGISHTNLSGVGCPDMGSLLLFPQSDSISIAKLSKGVLFENEIAKPGFYSCLLTENNIQFKTAAAARSAIEQYTFTGSKNYLVLNLGRSLSRGKGSVINIESNREITGYKIDGKFCGRSPDRKLFFVIELQSAASTIQLMEDGKLRSPEQKRSSANSNGVVIDIGNQKKLLLKIGLSYVSIANAKLNLQAEIPHWNFEQVQNQTDTAWNKLLSVIKLSGGTTGDRIKFYTALYHVLLHPNILNDVNGEYPLMGEQSKTGKVAGRNRYTVFSLWDTYRTVHPFLTLFYPHLQSQMVNSMVDMYKENGWLPKWELVSGESYTMVGDPGVPVIADAYVKGIRNIDIRAAYAAMLKQSSSAENMIRPGYVQYLKYGGFIPNNDKGSSHVWGSVSTSLEYNYADWCIAQLAKQLGDEKNYKEYSIRSAGYKNYFDKNYLLFRPKLRDGAWLKDFDPLDNWRELGWKPSGGIGFVEGSAWEYTWFVPHDIVGLKKLFGNEQSFVQQLQTCFDSSYFKLSNEPDMAYPWLFNYVSGEEWRTKKTVAECINKNFGTAADGLPGNDDCGTLSAWLLFAMLGFYPDCPGSLNYQTAMPVFDKIEIRLDATYWKHKTLLIEKRGNEMQINGEKVAAIIEHKKLVGK